MYKQLLIGLLLLICIDTYSQSCVEARYIHEIGVKEDLGNNDGIRIREYLKSTNINYPASWCSAFVKWVLNQCGIVTTITAWSPTAHNPNNLVYFKQKWNKAPKAGDVFTLYSQSKKRIAHTGFFHRLNNNIVITVEGNTNDGGSFNGDGVYMRKRSIHTIYSISRWTD